MFISRLLGENITGFSRERGRWDQGQENGWILSPQLESQHVQMLTSLVKNIEEYDDYSRKLLKVAFAASAPQNLRITLKDNIPVGLMMDKRQFSSIELDEYHKCKTIFSEYFEKHFENRGGDLQNILTVSPCDYAFINLLKYPLFVESLYPPKQMKQGNHLRWDALKTLKKKREKSNVWLTDCPYLAFINPLIKQYYDSAKNSQNIYSSPHLFLRYCCVFWMACHPIYKEDIDMPTTLKLCENRYLHNKRYANSKEGCLQCVYLLVEHVLRDPNLAEDYEKIQRGEVNLQHDTRYSKVTADQSFVCPRAIQTIQQPLFDLIRTTFIHKSLFGCVDGSFIDHFCLVVEVWLLYIQPWKFMANNREYDKYIWRPYVLANLHFYTTLHAIFIRFVSELDEIYDSSKMGIRIEDSYIDNYIDAIESVTALFLNNHNLRTDIHDIVEGFKRDQDNHGDRRSLIKRSDLKYISKNDDGSIQGLKICQDLSQYELFAIYASHAKLFPSDSMKCKYAAYHAKDFCMGSDIFATVKARDYPDLTIIEKFTDVVANFYDYKKSKLQKLCDMLQFSTTPESWIQGDICKRISTFYQFYITHWNARPLTDKIDAHVQMNGYQDDSEVYLRNQATKVKTLCGPLKSYEWPYLVDFLIWVSKYMNDSFNLDRGNINLRFLAHIRTSTFLLICISYLLWRCEYLSILIFTMILMISVVPLYHGEFSCFPLKNTYL
jgi:hypothetical protein